MNDVPDQRPQPPEMPLPCDCCDGGCDPCVYTVYSEAQYEFEKRLAVWKAAHPEEATQDH